MFTGPKDTQRDEKRTVYVGGFGEGVMERDLTEAFLPFGNIRSVIVRNERRGGGTNRYGFVEFESGEDAEAAIDNMHQAELSGHVLSVNYARPLRVKEARDPMRPVWADEDWLRRYGYGKDKASGEDPAASKKRARKRDGGESGDDKEGAGEEQQELVQIPAPKFI